MTERRPVRPNGTSESSANICHIMAALHNVEVSLANGSYHDLYTVCETLEGVSDDLWTLYRRLKAAS